MEPQTARLPHVPAESAELYEQLPDTLPAELIAAVNKPSTDIHTDRTYSYNGWDFDVPPRVHLPGATSRIIHDRLLDGTIPLYGRRYAALGVGLGVEAVIAGVRGAGEVYASDVHADSVDVTARHFRRLAGADIPFHPIVSDLFESYPDSAELDVVTFNAPTIAVRFSDDPETIRNLCVGTEIVQRFFGQLVHRDLLAPDGEIYLLASNTSDLRKIVEHAFEAGFRPQIAHIRRREDVGLQNHLFRLRRRA